MTNSQHEATEMGGPRPRGEVKVQEQGGPSGPSVEAGHELLVNVAVVIERTRWKKRNSKFLYF